MKTLIYSLLVIAIMSSCTGTSTRIQVLDVDSQQIETVRLGKYAGHIHMNDTIVIEEYFSSVSIRNEIYSLNVDELPKVSFIYSNDSSDVSMFSYYRAIVLSDI